jgi:hypothetical protein
MAEFGAAAGRAAEQLKAATKFDAAQSNVIVYYCAQSNEEFSWQSVKLPHPCPRLGIELVSTLAGNLLDRQRTQQGTRPCLFCQKNIAREEEYYVYLYQPLTILPTSTTIGHIMIFAYFCPSPGCIKEKDAWLQALRDSDTSDSLRGCAQCGAMKKKNEGRYPACGRCRMVNYCSKECQRAHWKMHKPFCSQFVRDIPAVSETREENAAHSFHDDLG